MNNTTELPTTPQTGMLNETPKVPDTKQSEKTVSHSLFSDLVGRKIPGMEAFETPVEPPKTEAQKEEPKPEVKQGPKYISPEEFADHLLKLKVDGVEEEATFADVIRRIQTDKHLTNKGQRLSEMEKSLREEKSVLAEREKLIAEIIANQSKPPKEEDALDSIIKDDPYVKRLEAEMQAMRQSLEDLNQQTAPTRLNAAIERVDKYAKDALGLTDFKDYQEKIREHLLSLPIEQARSLDNEAGWLGVFKDLKIRELVAKANEPKPEIKKPEPKSDDRPAPAIIPIESGSGVSKGFSDDETSKYRSLLETAKKLELEGSPLRHKAWEAVLGFQSGLP